MSKTSTATAGSSSSRGRTGSKSGKHGEENPDMSLTGIGNYAFDRTIGQGNFAKVKLARHKLTNQEVAVKMIDKTTLDEKKLSKLHREVRIMKMLNHPNIVKLFEVIETRHTLFLVMEYVNGGELYDYLVAHGRMKEKEARAKFRQILSAVNYCHKKRVIHRDLKAENLLLDSNLNIKIADFGFSNHFAPDGQLDTFCGSPPYAAPELFQGRKYTGPEVDIWSLGVILYVLCTGCLPFDGKDLKEMREVVCRGRYKVPFYLTDPCEKLMRKFLVRDPTKRAALDMLKDDPWVNDGYQTSPIDDVVADHVQTPDEEIIRFMCDKFNVTRDQIVQGLEQNSYEDISSIYLLLVDQKSNGRWVPYTGSALSPMSPVQLQQGTTTPISKATPMGTIGEEGDHANHAPQVLAVSSGGDIPAVVPRDRSHTVTGSSGNARQRPVTWVGTDSPAQHFDDGRQHHTVPAVQPPVGLEDMNPAATSSLLPRAPRGAHLRHTSSPTRITDAMLTDGGADEEADGVASHLPSSKKQATGPTAASSSTTAGGVINVIRSIGRRLSESAAPQPAAAAQAVINGANSGQNGTQATQLATSTTPADHSTAPTDADKPRSLRFTFNSNTTSSKNPDEIVKEIVQACARISVKTNQTNGRFLVECLWNYRDAPLATGATAEGAGSAMDMEQLQRALAEVMSTSTGAISTPERLRKEEMMQNGGDCVRFDVEVCELPRLKNLHGLRFRRIGGPSQEYKDICGKLLSMIHL